MLSFFLFAFLAASPPIEDLTVSVLDFARLSHAEALQWHGKRVTAWVWLDGPGTKTDRHTTYQLAGEGDVSRTMLLMLDQVVSDQRPQRVEGTLQVIDHPPSVINGVRFEGFTEYRLTDARKR